MLSLCCWEDLLGSLVQHENDCSCECLCSLRSYYHDYDGIETICSDPFERLVGRTGASILVRVLTTPPTSSEKSYDLISEWALGSALTSVHAHSDTSLTLCTWFGMLFSWGLQLYFSGVNGWRTLEPYATWRVDMVLRIASSSSNYI